MESNSLIPQPSSVTNILTLRYDPSITPNLPRKTWNNDKEYYKKAYMLSNYFIKNFEKFKEFADKSILDGAPNAR